MERAMVADAVQTIGLDLPLKALVWQDISGKPWLSYNDPAWLAKRHGLSGEATGGITAAVHAVTTAGTRLTAPLLNCANRRTR